MPSSKACKTRNFRILEDPMLLLVSQGETETESPAASQQPFHTQKLARPGTRLCYDSRCNTFKAEPVRFPDNGGRAHSALNRRKFSGGGLREVHTDFFDFFLIPKSSEIRRIFFFLHDSRVVYLRGGVFFSSGGQFYFFSISVFLGGTCLKLPN